MSANKPIKSLAQLRKEHKPAKAFTFEIDKDFVLIFEDFNYFDDERQMRVVDLLDKMDGNTATSYREIMLAIDDLFNEWLGEEVYEKLKETVGRTERAHIAGLAAQHFKNEHGTEDPKEQK